MKIAAECGVEELLPPSRKSKEYKETRLKEVGLRVRGTGIGQKVKGHKWERTLATRLEDRRKAMLAMPSMIRLWKQVSIALSFENDSNDWDWKQCFERSLTNCLIAWSRSWMEEVPPEVNSARVQQRNSRIRTFSLATLTHVVWPDIPFLLRRMAVGEDWHICI